MILHERGKNEFEIETCLVLGLEQKRCLAEFRPERVNGRRFFSTKAEILFSSFLIVHSLARTLKRKKM